MLDILLICIMNFKNSMLLDIKAIKSFFYFFDTYSMYSMAPVAESMLNWTPVEISKLCNCCADGGFICWYESHDVFVNEKNCRLYLAMCWKRMYCNRRSFYLPLVACGYCNNTYICPSDIVDMFDISIIWSSKSIIVQQSSIQ